MLPICGAAVVLQTSAAHDCRVPSATLVGGTGVLTEQSVDPAPMTENSDEIDALVNVTGSGHWSKAWKGFSLLPQAKVVLGRQQLS
jgi:hypothetical protein